MIEDFAALGLDETSLRALESKGFDTPTKIQSECIPLLLKGEKDVIGQAQTGTGKTAAFALPILQMLDYSDYGTQALVLTPTRELCMQISAEIDSLAGERNASIAPIYGGSSIEMQIRQLKKGLQIVVGTPGRILDHLRRGTLDLSGIRVCVLDEADEMLDMGFIEDIDAILEHTSGNRRTLCFSATMPAPILNLARKYMPDYVLVKTQTQDLTSELTRQVFYETRECDKTEVLMRVIEMNPDFYGIVFCRTRMQCDEVGHKLIDRGYNAEILNGDLSQVQRELTVQKMRSKVISILVASDVAARGIDIPDLTHVINYSLPQDPETYIHRVGRTGRAGKMGKAITFVTPGEFPRFGFFRKIVKSEIVKEQVPTIEQILYVKKQRMNKKLLDALNRPCGDAETRRLANEILKIKKPEEAVASLIAMYFEKQTDMSAFGEIQDLYEHRPRATGRSYPKREKQSGKRLKKRSNGDTRRSFYDTRRH